MLISCEVIPYQKIHSQNIFLLNKYNFQVKIWVWVQNDSEEGGKGVKEWFLQLLGHPYQGASHQQGKPLWPLGHWRQTIENLFSFGGKPFRPQEHWRQTIETQQGVLFVQTIELVVFASSLLTQPVVVTILTTLGGIEEWNSVSLENKNDSKIEQFLDVITADVALAALCFLSHRGKLCFKQRFKDITPKKKGDQRVS